MALKPDCPHIFNFWSRNEKKSLESFIRIVQKPDFLDILQVQIQIKRANPIERFAKKSVF